MPPLPVQSGPNMAQLDSMNKASKNSGSGSGLPSTGGGSGINSQVGGQVGQNLQQQSNFDNSLASIGGINPVLTKPAFTDDVISLMFDGNMSPAQIQYSQVFVTNIGVGDVSAASAFGPQKALHIKEGGHSFGNIGDIASR